MSVNNYTVSCPRCDTEQAADIERPEAPTDSPLDHPDRLKGRTLDCGRCDCEFELFFY